MSTEQNNPTILVAPFRHEIEVFDPGQADNVRVEDELGLKLNLYEYASILGVLAANGVGDYANAAVAEAADLNVKGLGSERAKLIERLFPEYISYDKRFRVLQNFSVAVALEQPGDAAILRAKKHAESDKRRNKKLEIRQQHIGSLQTQLDQLVAEATYTPEAIAGFDRDKTDLYEYDSIRFNVADESYVVPLIGPEDMVCARIFMELAALEQPKLGVYSSGDMAQRAWQAMPHQERRLFANTYRGDAPELFTRMFSRVAGELSQTSAFQDAGSYKQSLAYQPMQAITNIELLAEEPDDDQYDEFAVQRFDTAGFAVEREKQLSKDKASRQKIRDELRSLGVSIEDQLQPLQQKAKLEYAPEDQLIIKAPMAELLRSILTGETGSLTQPQAMEVVYAANNPRYYRAIENLGTALETPVTLEAAVRTLDNAAHLGLGDSYHGFASRNRTIGRATVKRLHRR